MAGVLVVIMVLVIYVRVIRHPTMAMVIVGICIVRVAVMMVPEQQIVLMI
jgi:hypothetical protein